MWASRLAGSIVATLIETEAEKLLGPKLFFVTGLVIFAKALARLVCLDLLG